MFSAGYGLTWPLLRQLTQQATSSGYLILACSLHLHCFDSPSPQPLFSSLTHSLTHSLTSSSTIFCTVILEQMLHFWSQYYITEPFTTLSGPLLHFWAFIYILQVSLFHKCSQSYCTPECSSPLLLITPALLLQLTAATVTALLTAAVHYSSSSLGPCSPVTSAQAPGTPRSASPQSYITPHPGILHIALKFG